MTTNKDAQVSAELPRALAIWALVCLWLVLCKLVLAAMPPIDIPLIRSEFATSTIAVYAAIGALGVVLACFARFPPPVGGGVDVRTRYLWPIAIGAGLGAIATLIDQFTHGTDFLAQQTGDASFNVAMPQALPVYLAGPVLPEAVYHILPLALFALISRAVVKDQAGRLRALYVTAAIVALIEPALQGGGIIALSHGDRVHLFFTQFLPYFATNYPLNLAACLFFIRGGFLSPIAVRLGFYLVWHIIYGALLYQPHVG